MENSKADLEQGFIKLLHIPLDELPRLTRVINRIWFFYELKAINSDAKEDAFFQNLPHMEEANLFDILITDFRHGSPLSQERKIRLIDFLKKHRCPLISLSHNQNLDYDDSDPNWLHISVPVESIEDHIDEINNIVANFWFCLPSDNLPAD